MPEKLPENYEQGLQEFIASQADYQTTADQLREIKRKIWSQHLQLELAIKGLSKLRHQRAFEIMEEKGLGICSAEIVPEEFKLKHPDFKKTSESEKLGLFLLGKLRFLYFYDKRWVGGGHYESEYSYKINYILSLCPHHFPKKTSFSLASIFSYARQHPTYTDTECLPYWKEVTQKDGQPDVFIDKSQNENRNIGWKISPLPETIFEYFQIPSLPELPQEPR
ncbi:MAG: hypothetical protein Q7R43_04070 [Candidatus Daviesbacteria bacterium]|nr:hypothetical protein [Candidatus Daviesbacteria bacterium]